MSRKPKALVIYHSHSGNTKKLALEAEKVLNDLGFAAHAVALRNMDDGLPVSDPDVVVLGTPVHFWKIPVPALGLIRALPDFPEAWGFVFATYGTVFDSNALYDLARELRDKGVHIAGGASVLSPHNFLTPRKKRLGDTYSEFGLGQPGEDVLARFREAVATVAKRMLRGEPPRFDVRRLATERPIVTKMDNLLSVEKKRAALPRVQHSQDLCRKCGTCLKGCDTGAIRLDGDRVSIDHDKCYRCYNCIRNCPADALDTDWKTIEKVLRGLKRVVRNTGTRIEY
ncbi:MAG: EFR1 family ferrodoxin [Desulfatibacillaceae bacterium]